MMSVGAPAMRTRAYDGRRRQERARQQREADPRRGPGPLPRPRLRRHHRRVDRGEGPGVGGHDLQVLRGQGGPGPGPRERALAGTGPIPAEERANALRSLPDPVQVIEGWARLAAEVAPRVAPLLLLLRDAARADPEAGALADELDQSRLARMAENARYLAFAGHLRPGVTAVEARDVLWLCSSPELFDLLVQRRGWSLDQFSRFVADTMTKALL